MINGPILYSHFGAEAAMTDAGLTYDIRTEVALLTRNIKIRGDGTNWGGQLLVTEW